MTETVALSVHHGSTTWAELQAAGLRREFPDVRIVFVGDAELGLDRWADDAWAIEGDHPTRLDAAAARVLADSTPDRLLFIDGDAVVLDGAGARIQTALDGVPCAAMVRTENGGDRQPHPAFCVLDASLWRDLDLSWQVGPTDGAIGRGRDVGGLVLQRFEAEDVRWARLARSNRHDVHPLFFGIYGEVVYHHGAGFRRPWSRTDQRRAVADMGRRPLLPVWQAIARYAPERLPTGRRILERNRALGQVFERWALDDLDSLIAHLDGRPVTTPYLAEVAAIA